MKVNWSNPIEVKAYFNNWYAMKRKEAGIEERPPRLILTPDEYKLAFRMYYQLNNLVIGKKRKKRKRKSRRERLKVAKLYREKNKEEIDRKHKIWRDNNREKIVLNARKRRARISYGEYAEIALLRNKIKQTLKEKTI